MDRLGEIRARVEKASKGPWTTCHEGKCRCKQVWCADDHPVAVIECGEWGDDYPAIRPIDGNKMGGTQVEAYTEKIVYGSIHEETANANANFMAHAREDIPYLLDLLAIAEKLSTMG